ncbi:Clp protease N-terminal domain-containing protein [Mesorhizobium muleiense]|uniref:Clp protease N-terminal domain-containing protein n=1 Tax=Mesorhizobium muleiense TaxID=1004279 RepID=UPI001F3A6C9A|nr:Clp protease N-terminal domain-containing protein [Mesorhizobium muleiense]MCF6120951.1 Clp protease N-terminal domain-containing protein [Mesorhizobium muleiense]
MLSGIKTRLSNARTIKTLCESAENYALKDQQRQAGAEHFLLAAIDLPDNTARLAFREIGADAAGFRDAVGAQYWEALRSVGVNAGEHKSGGLTPEPLQGAAGLYDAAPSGAEVMKELAANRNDHRPLLGAHVVAIVAAMEQGVAARALRCMGVDPAALKAAANKFSRASYRPTGLTRA